MDLAHVFRDYEGRLSFGERAGVVAAPLTGPPLPGQPESFFSLELQEMRWLVHREVRFLGHDLARGRDQARKSYKHFESLMVVAEFELRHLVVRSWPGFVLLFHKLFGPVILPWAAPLFLSAVALPAMPDVEFDLSEVLGFAKQLTFSRGPDGMGHGLQDSHMRSDRLEIWQRRTA